MKLSFFDPQNDARLISYVKNKEYSNEFPPFNFYSLLDYGIRLDKLYPKQEIMDLLMEERDGDGNTLKFDQAYCNQLLNDEETFKALMQIVIQLQVISEVNVLSNYTNPLIMPILDSLIKFIQERYGIDSYIINEYEDIDELKYSSFESIDHRAVYIKDCERYAKMTKTPIITAITATQKEIEEDQQALREYALDRSLTNYDTQGYGIV